MLNTDQSVQSIISQYKTLIRENSSKRILVTSIIPASDSNGEIDKIISEINKKLEKISDEEGAVYLDMENIFKKGEQINREMFKAKGRVSRLTQLNENGCKQFVSSLASKMEACLGTSLQKQVFRPASLKMHRS